MEKLLIATRRFLRDEEGVTAIEYGLIAALIAVVIIAGATLVGTNLNTLFTDISGCLATPQTGGICA
jgi:pilus assembly protein Flp/PilA